MFQGFNEPKENWSKLPHEFINALPLVSSESELKVILYILRHTWGYGDSEKKITLDEFANGRKRRDGTHIDNGTGQSINAIKDGLKRAAEHGFIDSETDESDKARHKSYYWLKMSEVDSGVSEVDSQQSTVDPRTEKETKKETKKEGASKNDARPTESPKASTHPAIVIYREVKRSYPRKELYPMIIEQVGDSQAALDLWRAVLIGWSAVGWNPMNVSGMLEFFRRGEIPKTNGNGNKGRMLPEDRGVKTRMSDMLALMRNKGVLE
ncbi:MAG: hypothetical protein A2W25_15495 [candidate division Zixibacteria bacterium RBG_16_53_22]|nr:MAG: hypothetical protein A2W25_15495 [candidate division Zixibacteria bacterium RBG_16_53_22]